MITYSYTQPYYGHAAPYYSQGTAHNAYPPYPHTYPTQFVYEKRDPNPNPTFYIMFTPASSTFGRDVAAFFGLMLVNILITFFGALVSDKIPNAAFITTIILVCINFLCMRTFDLSNIPVLKYISFLLAFWAMMSVIAIILSSRHGQQHESMEEPLAQNFMSLFVKYSPLALMQKLLKIIEQSLVDASEVENPDFNPESENSSYRLDFVLDNLQST